MADGYPRLLAVQQVGAIGLLHGNACHGIVVRACARLGNGRYRNAGARNVVHHVHDLLLLLFVAEFDDVHDGVEVGLERQHARGVLMELFHQQHQRELVARNAAYLFRQSQVHKAQLAESHGSLEADMVIDLICLLDGFRRKVLFRVLLRAGNEQLLVWRQFEIHYSP